MTATTTVPVRRPVRDNYLQRDHVRGLWTIVGFVYGLLAAVAFIVCMFLVELNERVEEGTNAAGQTVQRTITDTAWSADGMVGFLFPIALFVILWVLFASARMLTRDWHKVVAQVIAICFGIALGVWVVELIGEDLDWDLVLLGFAASMAVILGVILAHVFYVRHQRAALQSLNDDLGRRQAWIDRCETYILSTDVDLNAVP